MATVPADLSLDRRPPLFVPLRHFVLALAFPLLAVPIGIAARFHVGAAPLLAHVHLLLAGWVCVTIMGAMTLFVPVWSGVALHSRRLAAVQLPLAVVGVLGIGASFLVGRLDWLPVGGGLLLAALWCFVYNLGRSLLDARPLDVTERHFAFALACFAVVPVLGLLLALDYAAPVFGPQTVFRSRVLGAHATLAVFGAVLSTVAGALYQLATMFTGTERRGIDVPLQRFESVGYPLGVVTLAGGRLLASPVAARVGAGLVLLGLAAVAVFLARRLLRATVAPTPMHARYAVAAVSLLAWVVLATPAWLVDPLAADALLGPLGATALLVLGAVGFVVLGTLYHVVPFVVWVDRYSDRLGLEPVPLVDDLYDARIARLDFVALVVGLAGLVLADLVGGPAFVAPVAGLLVLAGFVLFAGNVALVLHRHAPGSAWAVLVGRWGDAPDDRGVAR